jgi:arsenate reductase (glutaredoxin)
MKHTIFGIKNCDIMKKAFTWLDAQGLDYEFIDYKKAGVVADHIDSWNQRIGWEALLNRKGLTWKKLSETDRSNVDEAKALALMKTHPTLIKRPVLVGGKKTIVGFSPESYAVFTQSNL